MFEKDVSIELLRALRDVAAPESPLEPLDTRVRSALQFKRLTASAWLAGSPTACVGERHGAT